MPPLLSSWLAGAAKRSTPQRSFACLVGAETRCPSCPIRLCVGAPAACGPAALWPCSPVGAKPTPARCSCVPQKCWLGGACRTIDIDIHIWIATAASRAYAHLVCLVCLVLPVSILSSSQSVLRGRLTLGNWLILASCTSIRHRRVSKTLPSSASIAVVTTCRGSGPAQNGGDLSPGPYHGARVLTCACLPCRIIMSLDRAWWAACICECRRM